MNMSTLVLIAQGALAGLVAGHAYPEFGVGFWAAIVVNSALFVSYGALKRNE